MIEWKLEIMLALTVLALIAWGYTYANVEENETLDTEPERKNNDDWHRGKAIVITLLYTAIAIGVFNFTWKTPVWVIAQTFLTIVVFNPSINMFKGVKGYFYLSDEGIEGKFKKFTGEKGYYFLALAVFVAGYLVVKLL